MTDAEMLSAIHGDVREIREDVKALTRQVADGLGRHDERLRDLEAHVGHPTRWDIGGLLAGLGAIAAAVLRDARSG